MYVSSTGNSKIVGNLFFIHRQQVKTHGGKGVSLHDKTFKKHYDAIANAIAELEADLNVAHARDPTMAAFRRMCEEDIETERVQYYDVNNASIVKTKLLDAIADYQ